MPGTALHDLPEIAMSECVLNTMKRFNMFDGLVNREMRGQGPEWYFLLLRSITYVLEVLYVEVYNT